MKSNLRSSYRIILLGISFSFGLAANDSLTVADQSIVNTPVVNDTLSMDSSASGFVGGLNFRSEQNPDLLYKWARDAALTSKNYALAIKIAKQGLVIAPDYVDIRLLLGRLYAWNGQYDSARVELEQVVAANPAYVDARNALVDALMWNKNYEPARGILEAGLEMDPGQVDFRYKLAICTLELGDKKTARELLEALLKDHPDHEQAAAVLGGLEPEPRKRKISVLYTLNRLADTQTQWQMLVGETSLDPWQLLSVELEQKFEFGPVIARFNVADRYGRSGQQLEIESYPLICEGTYAYVALGYSWTELFPKFRTGAEIFQALPQAMEMSIGYRSLHFADQDLMVLAGSFSKYHGNYWMSARTFLTPDEGALSRALNLQVRRYLKGADTFVELSVGQGETPGVGIGEDEINYLGARHLGVMCQWKLDDSQLIKGIITLSNVEIRESAYRGDTGFGFAYSRLF
ncbi:MAG: YaiO family outer membrane beta-barrel protein [Candidatus Marinimicrobia bacterium]|nr:YaiO family outer membrane beta-barrel protein [Candidatus Neomarinimicrobiota bacterium]MCF7850370.1 YaiO family outer membrane beta-barrel protein [Candidatus Neomarinimicrobiota bacterium]MCF7904495.1 YaiO family outer membrane beta-barrel protein [Candidatus Neomarinimicrobiota bacterium]